MTQNDNAKTYLQLVARNAAENVPQVAARVNLAGDEREAFAVTEQVCSDVAAGRRG